MILPETAGQKLLLEHGRVVGVRTGDKGRGRDGEPLGNFEPGVDMTARITVLAEGTAGPPDGGRDRPLRPRGAQPADLGARREGGLEGREAARPDHPHDGLAAAQAREVRRVRRLVRSTRWARSTSRSASSSGSSTRDVELSAHDLLQEFKTHRLVRKILEGGERVAWGAKTITEGGLHSLPAKLNAPGPAPRRRERRARQRAAAEGRPLRDRVRAAGRRGRVRGAPARRGRRPARGARPLRRRRPRELHVEGARRGPEHAPGVRQGLLHRRRARERDDGHEGRSCRRRSSRRTRTPTRRCSAPGAPRVPGARREADLRQALVRLRLRATARATTSRTTCASRRRSRATSPRCGSGCAPRRSTRWATPTATGRSR